MPGNPNIKVAMPTQWDKEENNSACAVAGSAYALAGPEKCFTSAALSIA